jgi:hypothetical protein
MSRFLGCAFCKHFQQDLTCKAFPDGIPLEIVGGTLEHLKVLPGQKGKVVFEQGEYLQNVESK